MTPVATSLTSTSTPRPALETWVWRDGSKDDVRSSGSRRHARG